MWAPPSPLPSRPSRRGAIPSPALFPSFAGDWISRLGLCFVLRTSFATPGHQISHHSSSLKIRGRLKGESMVGCWTSAFSPFILFLRTKVLAETLLAFNS